MSEAILRYREAKPYEFGLFPVDDEGAELFRKLKLNRDVHADVKQRRNMRQHRLFFAILQFVKEHCALFESRSIDEIKDAVKLACGLADKYIDQEDGKTYYVLKSISPSKMDQTEFASFFNDACNVVAQRWMPAGVTAEDVRRELLEMVDGPYATDARARA